MPRSPNYTSLSLIEMREVVARTLRDPNGGVFSVDALNDFIAEGLMSLSGYRPIEAFPMPRPTTATSSMSSPPS
jgi:hypothetical protein